MEIVTVIGMVIAIIWFFCSRYAPRSIAGLLAFAVFSLILSPVITIPVQWVYAKYMRY